MTPQEVKPYLDSFINYELMLNTVTPSQFKLKRVERLLQELGNPHKQIRCVHVAGSKGKGSTCAFAATILRQAGYRVGLYTSPHLKSFKERIRILSHQENDNGEIFSDCITDEELAKFLGEMKSILEKFRRSDKLGQLTYYEVLTVLAFYYFQRERVDCAVLETGLGGRLDATNVVDSLVCGITPISLEHTQILGNTLEAIAREKAAIIKANRPTVIVAPQEKEALKVIEDQCQAKKTKSFYVGKDISIEMIQQDLSGLILKVHGQRGEYTDLRTNLLGSHQMINAATAIGMIEALAFYGIPVSAQAIREGIEQTQWPGRFEIVQQKPYVILDCAHSPSSSLQLAKTMEELFPGKKVRLVFGVSDDKNRVEICRYLNPIAQEVILTKANHPRACELSREEMQNYFPGKPLRVTNNVQYALEMAWQNMMMEDVILVTGSIFVIAEARNVLETKYASNR